MSTMQWSHWQEFVKLNLDGHHCFFRETKDLVFAKTLAPYFHKQRKNHSFYIFSSHTKQPVADLKWQYNSKDMPKLKLKCFRLNQNGLFLSSRQIACELLQYGVSE